MEVVRRRRGRGREGEVRMGVRERQGRRREGKIGNSQEETGERKERGGEEWSGGDKGKEDRKRSVGERKERGGEEWSGKGVRRQGKVRERGCGKGVRRRQWRGREGIRKSHGVHEDGDDLWQDWVGGGSGTGKQRRHWS